MQTLSDQIGRSLTIEQPPERIVSLVPSLTELLCDMGLGYKIVGKTRYCIHPENTLSDALLVGGTKRPDIGDIIKLKPDFILVNKEENTLEAVEKLEKIAPIYVSDISDFEGLSTCLTDLSKIFGLVSGGDALLTRMKMIIAILQAETAAAQAINVLYLIWKKPYMAAGSDTYINSMLETIQLKNVLLSRAEAGTRYPKLSIEAIQDLKPDIILLSSEPYRFDESDRLELASATGIPCICVDGEAFSWYGTRILYLAPYLSQLRQEIDILSDSIDGHLQ